MKNIKKIKNLKKKIKKENFFMTDEQIKKKINKMSKNKFVRAVLDKLAKK